MSADYDGKLPPFVFPLSLMLASLITSHCERLSPEPDGKPCLMSSSIILYFRYLNYCTCSTAAPPWTQETCRPPPHFFRALRAIRFFLLLATQVAQVKYDIADYREGVRSPLLALLPSSLIFHAVPYKGCDDHGVCAVGLFVVLISMHFTSSPDLLN
jgi:hypothetical protein